MFGEQFYPTPEPLIKKALKKYFKEAITKSSGFSRYNTDGYDFGKLSVLDPSAGKGNFLDFIKNNNEYYEADLNAIEIDADLQSILRDKGYPIIASDFLDFNESYYWDLIVMNPPFKNGDEHLLHAISLATVTNIVCILNAETIRNPYSTKRKQLLELIEQNGTYEFHKEEFKDAERKTMVEVAIVDLQFNRKNENFDFNFEKEKSPELNFDFDVEQNNLARIDLIGNFQTRFNIILDLYQKKLKSDARYDYHFQAMFKNGKYYDSIIKSYHLDSGSPEQKYNHLAKSLKVYMWQQVIKKLDVQKYMSAKISKNFEAFIRQQSEMAFTKENVAIFFQTIMNNRKNIWDTAVTDIFDVLTKHSEANRMSVPKWKTNDYYKINRKIILPYWCEWDVSYMEESRKKSFGAKFKLRYQRNQEYTDIDKVLAYLSGHKLMDYSTIDYALENKFEELGNVKTGEKFDNTCESGYFNIKFHKSGTVHLTFKDKKLWDYFNYTACGLKNWLPGSEKTKWEEEKKRRRDERKGTNTAPNHSAEAEPTPVLLVEKTQEVVEENHHDNYVGPNQLDLF